jgi:cytochrome c oxidase assembly protein subunit 15
MEKWLRRSIRTAWVCIYLVLIAGSVVRMSGAGMGCPDWPKCFGYLIPPTEEAQVIWTSEHPYERGQMIVREDALWVAQSDFVSGEVWDQNNWERYDRHDYAIFNPIHTWTEYVNRLIGAFSGIPALLTVVLAFAYRRRNRWIFILSLLALAMLLFEAWLGKVVVDGNLIPGQITIHMAGAFVLILLYGRMLALMQVKRGALVSKRTRQYLWVGTFLLVVQVLSGTQVREIVDTLYGHFPRVEWIDQLDWKFKFHRSFANLLVIVAILLFMEYRKWKQTSLLIISGLIILGALSGIGLSYLGMPAAIQPLHLLLSALLFGLFTYQLTRYRRSNV